VTDPGAQGARDAIVDREQGIGLWIREPLRVLKGTRSSDATMSATKAPSNEGAAHHLDVIRRQSRRDLRGQPPDGIGAQTQQLEVEPQIPVMSRLE